MAYLIPEKPKDCTNGERIVLEQLARELSDDCIIFHSLGLHDHQTKIWGEIDLVLLSPKGIYVLEVKGGKVDCKDGVWTFGDPIAGRSYSKKEDPWSQASGAMFALRDRLASADPTLGKLLIGYGVMMPMVAFDARGVEIEPKVLYDRRDLNKNAGFYLGRLQEHWKSVYEKKHGKVPPNPTVDQIKAMRTILRPDIATSISLGSWLTGLDSAFVELTNDQLRISRRMESNPRTIVRGKAGTGKTLIALDRAKRLAARGMKVLFLCYNQLLARHLRDSLVGESIPPGKLDIYHVHAFYSKVIREACLQDRLDRHASDPRFFSDIFPELFIEAAIELELPHWDVLIIDEAQDVMTPSHLNAFDFIVLGEKGLNRGCWHFFLDPLQNLYAAELADAAEQRVAEAHPVLEDLEENCRNTLQVAIEGSIISGIDFALAGAPAGPKTRLLYYRESREIPTLLDDLIEGWLRDGLRPSDIAVLSPYVRENSALAAVGRLAGERLVDVGEATEGDMIFATVHSFKGLERKAVIAVDMEGIGEERHRMLHYVSLSRARALLCMVLPESSKDAYRKQSMLYGAKLVT